MDVAPRGNPAFAAFKTPWAENFPGLLRAEQLFDLKAYPHEKNASPPIRRNWSDSPKCGGGLPS